MLDGLVPNVLGPPAHALQEALRRQALASSPAFEADLEELDRREADIMEWAQAGGFSERLKAACVAVQQDRARLLERQELADQESAPRLSDVREDLNHGEELFRSADRATQGPFWRLLLTGGYIKLDANARGGYRKYRVADWATGSP